MSKKKESIGTNLGVMLGRASAQVHGEATLKEAPPAPTNEATTSTRNIGIRISDDLHRRLRVYVAKRGVKIKDLIVTLLEERLAQDE